MHRIHGLACPLYVYLFGVAVEDIAAGIACSVVRNALFRIIGLDRLDSLGDCVVVQGGPFMSDAVLRAFELVSGKEVVRLDTAHLMGAIGAALTARERALTARERAHAAAREGACAVRSGLAAARSSTASSLLAAAGVAGAAGTAACSRWSTRRWAPVRERQPLRSRARHRRSAPRLLGTGREAPAQRSRTRAQAACEVLGGRKARGPARACAWAS